VKEIQAMPKTLLEVDSSPLGERSISRHLTHEFVAHWKQAHPDGRIIKRDLNATSISPIDAGWITAVYTPEDQRTPEQRHLLGLSDTLISELQAADHYIIGVPMHNFSIPSVLKLWIDQVARANKTFSYANGRPEGLLKGKKATIIISSGGNYDAGTAMESFNFVEPYLRTVLAFLGVTETTFITAGGASAVSTGKVDRENFVQPLVESIRAQFQPVA
jgi:FMN-dependent NADH-azoreductase